MTARTVRTATAAVTRARAVPAATVRRDRSRPAFRADAYTPRSPGLVVTSATVVPRSSVSARARAARATGRVSRSRESLRSSPCTAWASGPARTGVRSGSRSTPFSVASGRPRSRNGGRPSTIV
ncbi:hypothetical protein [Streptomyces sp. CB09001]|uniref:hypothetical protein n=1 Tax=Streptomyces sp. CB09001 TaxID=2083284 RepID=UPI0031FCC43D